MNNKPTAKNEGVITYTIEYPEEVKMKDYASFLPTKMITTFKRHNYKISIKGELSLYDLQYISRANGDSSTTLFRVFDKRIFHNHEDGEHLFLFEKNAPAKVEFIKKETKEIAGYICNKAIVHFENADISCIHVFYTEQIDFKRPKENSPFDDIPGALLQFCIPYKGLNLTFSAKAVELKEVNDKTFETPDNYQETGRGEIAELVSSLIQ